MSDSKKKIGFVIGEKGKKYGLQVRASSATTAARKPVLAAFAAADASDESDDSANGRPVATSHASTRITQAQHAAALAADPTAFAYDEVLDDLVRRCLSLSLFLFCLRWAASLLLLCFFLSFLFRLSCMLSL